MQFYNIRQIQRYTLMIHTLLELLCAHICFSVHVDNMHYEVYLASGQYHLHMSCLSRRYQRISSWNDLPFTAARNSWCHELGVYSWGKCQLSITNKPFQASIYVALRGSSLTDAMVLQYTFLSIQFFQFRMKILLSLLHVQQPSFWFAFRYTLYWPWAHPVVKQ